jgi:hypothetical protein
MEEVSIFYVHLVYFTANWYILYLQLGIFYGHLEYFSPLGVLYQEKSGNPGPKPPNPLLNKSSSKLAI